MIGLVAPIGLAALAAFVLGGSPTTLARQRIRWSALGTGALAFQAALFCPPLDQQPWALEWGKWLWFASMLAVLAMLLKNALVASHGLRHAWTMAALGVAANCLVVAVNGGVMPRTIPVDTDQTATEQHLSNVYVAERDAPLIWLGDVIAQPAWLPMANAVSIGDLLLSMGLAWWVFQSAFDGRRTTTARPGRWFDAFPERAA